MARIKHTKSIEAQGGRGARKQLMLIGKLQSRMKQKNSQYGAKKMSRKHVETPSKQQQVEEPAKRKHRWRPGTVVRREIRKLTRSTHPLFPKASFSRVVREICQNKVPKGGDMRFTENAMKAIQEAAEVFVTETFHKADLARKHARRETVGVKDLRFSRFMTPDSLWVMTDRMWEENFFAPAPAATLPPAAKLKQTEAAFKDVSALEKKLKKKSLTKSKSKKVDKSKKDGSVKLTAAAEDDDETQQDNAAEDDAAEEAEDDEPPSVPSGDGEGDVAEAED